MSVQRDAPAQESELLDVQLLDVIAQIESLLRGARHVQRGALRVRGVPAPVSSGARREAAVAVRRHIAEMRAHCNELEDMLENLEDTAAGLQRMVSGNHQKTR